jgi:hypothetical protein
VAAALAVAAGVAASCRSIPNRGGAAAVPRPDSNAVVQAATLANVVPPVIRVGILTDVPRASVGADWGVIVKGLGADGAAINVTVQRATFLPATSGVGGRLRLLETGQEIGSAALFPANADQELAVDGVPYPAAPEKGPTIQQGVGCDQHEREPVLVRRREARRIDQRHEVVIDEAAAVAGFTGALPQGVLERRQRADAVRGDNPGRPGQRRQVQPGDPRPPDHQHSAAAGEHDEGEVQHQHRIGRERVRHLSAPRSP